MLQSLRRLALLPWLGLSIVACADLDGFVERNFNDTTTGTGPLTLSSDVQHVFNEYLKRPTPLYFAVAENGQASFYSYCNEMQCARATSKAVIYECEKRSDGVPCKIYASGRNVTWKHDQS